MTAEIILQSICTKVWDRAGIELRTPVSAVRHASVARLVTDCATRPGKDDWKSEIHRVQQLIMYSLCAYRSMCSLIRFNMVIR